MSRTKPACRIRRTEITLLTSGLLCTAASCCPRVDTKAISAPSTVTQAPPPVAAQKPVVVNMTVDRVFYDVQAKTLTAVLSSLEKEFYSCKPIALKTGLNSMEFRSHDSADAPVLSFRTESRYCATIEAVITRIVIAYQREFTVSVPLSEYHLTDSAGNESTAFPYGDIDWSIDRMVTYAGELPFGGPQVTVHLQGSGRLHSNQTSAPR